MTFDPLRRLPVLDQPAAFVILGDPDEVVTPPATGDELVLDDLTAGILDEDYLAASTFGTAMDVSDRCRGFSWSRGRGSIVAHYKAGSATVRLDNRDGALTPVLPALAGSLRPGWPIVLGARYGAVDEPVFRGTVRSISETRPRNVDSVLELVCDDAVAEWSGSDQPALSAAGAGETLGDRLHRVADYFGWPVGRRAFDEGEIPLQATTLAATAWADALIAADTEGGFLWCDRRGTMVAHDRARLWEPATVGPAWVLSDALAAGTLPIVGTVTNHYDTDELRNDVELARTGGTAERLTDEDSISYYGRHSYVRHDLIHNAQADVVATVASALAQWSDPDVRFSPIGWNAGRGDWADVFPTLELRDGLELVVDGLTRRALIEQIRGRYEVRAGWSGDLIVSSISSAFLDALILDDALQGYLDANTLGV